MEDLNPSKPSEQQPAESVARAASTTDGGADSVKARVSEQVKEIMKGINKMNIGGLTKECNARKIDLTSVKKTKDALVTVLRKHIETEVTIAANNSATSESASIVEIVAPAPQLKPETQAVAGMRDVIARVSFLFNSFILKLCVTIRWSKLWCLNQILLLCR
jgi:hypothetical protein